MQEKSFRVPAISCGHCVQAITVELEDVAGVTSVEGDAEAKTVTVRFDQPASWEAIAATLAEIGYPPES